jgi:hypothetical protein
MDRLEEMSTGVSVVETGSLSATVGNWRAVTHDQPQSWRSSNPTHLRYVRGFL